MRLVQLKHPSLGRRVARVEEPALQLIDGVDSIYRLALEAIRSGKSLREAIAARAEGERLDYDAVYDGGSAWKLLPAMDHPDDPNRCLVTGTGLTHRASAENRDQMHQAQAAGHVNDSMRMYQWGVDGGRPARGEVGAQPEWFWKGTGDVLRAHGEALEVPEFADDGGEEPEVVGAYLIDDDGAVWRIGLATGNEFADHVMEKKNYLYLAHSKVRQCAIGPELVVGESFEALAGKVEILRDGEPVWQSDIRSGEQHMAHSLGNLEHHHFKYPEHRTPGHVHLHFLGASAFSFGAQIELQDGDVMQIQWRELGRGLCNSLRNAGKKETLVEVRVLNA